MQLTMVIPCYNEEESIGTCLDHLVAQEVPFDECLIVDNRCTDRTVEIAMSYCDRLPIRVVREESPGVFRARQTGFREAGDGLIGRIDADTRIEPDWTKRVLKIMEARPDAAALTAVAYGYDAPFADYFKKKMRNEAASEKFSPDVLPVGRTLFGANMVIRKSAWLEVNSLQLGVEGIHEDHDLYWALHHAGKLVLSAPTVLAGVSARRYAAPFSDNVTYYKAAIMSPYLHGERGAAIKEVLKFPMIFIMFSVMKIVLVPFDPETRTWRPFRNAWRGRVSPVN